MLVMKVKKWVWLVAAMGLLASTSSQADYLYKGGYYQKRSQGSGYERKYHRNNRYKTIKVRRYIRQVAPRRVAPRRVAPRRNYYPANNFRRENRRPYRGNTGQYFNRGRNNGYNNRPYTQQRRACRSVESAIWAAQRRYPGGKVINARARRGPYGRTRYIEVRILYRGRVAVVREGC